MKPPEKIYIIMFRESRRDNLWADFHTNKEDAENEAMGSEEIWKRKYKVFEYELKKEKP